MTSESVLNISKSWSSERDSQTDSIQDVVIVVIHIRLHILREKPHSLRVEFKWSYSIFMYIYMVTGYIRKKSLFYPCLSIIYLNVFSLLFLISILTPSFNNIYIFFLENNYSWTSNKGAQFNYIYEKMIEYNNWINSFIYFFLLFFCYRYYNPIQRNFQIHFIFKLFLCFII